MVIVDMLEMQVLILMENLIEITILIRIEMTIYLKPYLLICGNTPGKDHLDVYMYIYTYVQIYVQIYETDAYKYIQICVFKYVYTYVHV